MSNWSGQYVDPVKMCGGAAVWWLARWTSDLEVGGSSLVSAVMLFP